MEGTRCIDVEYADIRRYYIRDKAAERRTTRAPGCSRSGGPSRPSSRARAAEPVLRPSGPQRMGGCAGHRARTHAASHAHTTRHAQSLPRTTVVGCQLTAVALPCPCHGQDADHLLGLIPFDVVYEHARELAHGNLLEGAHNEAGPALQAAGDEFRESCPRRRSLPHPARRPNQPHLTVTRQTTCSTVAAHCSL